MNHATKTLLFTLLILLSTFPALAASPYSGNVKSSPEETSSEGKTKSHKAATDPRISTHAVPASKTKQTQTIETKATRSNKDAQNSNLKTNTNVTINPSPVTRKISEKNAYQVQVGPVTPNVNISDQQGQPVRQYRVEQGPVKPVDPDRAKKAAPEVRREGIRTWKIDASGNRVEGQGELRVIEGPAR